MSKSKEMVFCGSSVIDRDLNNYIGVYEFPDGLMVEKEVCNRCMVNCPNAPGYLPPTIPELEARLAHSLRHQTFSF